MKQLLTSMAHLRNAHLRNAHRAFLHTLFLGLAMLTQQVYAQSARFENLDVPKKLQIPQFTSLPGTVVPRGFIHVTGTADTGSWVGAADGSRWIRAGSGSGGSTSWGLSGNAVTSTNFLGTTTNEDLVFKRNGTQVARLQYNRTSVGAFSGDSSNAMGQNQYGFKAGVKADNAPYLSAHGYYSAYRAKNAAYGTFGGPFAGDSAVNAWYASALGHSALAFADSAYYAAALGHMTLFQARKAYYTVAIGANAGWQATNAWYSLLAGPYAGYGSPNLKYSTVLGPYAGKATTGRYNIYVGLKAGSGFAFYDPQDNNIVIGNNISLPDSANNMANIGGALFISGLQSNIDATDPIVTATTEAKVGINTNAPAAGTQLDMGGSAGGLGLPRHSTAERDALAARTGNTIYNTTTNTVQTYNGSGWETFQGPSTGRLQAGSGISITNSSGGSLTGKIFGTDTITIAVTGTVQPVIGYNVVKRVADDTLYLNNTYYTIDSLSLGIGKFFVIANIHAVFNSVTGGGAADVALATADSLYAQSYINVANLANVNASASMTCFITVASPQKVYLYARRTDGAAQSYPSKTWLRGTSTYSSIARTGKLTKISYIQVE